MPSSLRERLEAAQKRKENSQPSAPDCNLLLCSDHHLGEFIKEHARIDYLKRSLDVDRHLCTFLEHYANHRVDGKPWRLVINGDFFDFSTVTVKPSPTVQAQRPELVLDEEEQIFGLDSDEAKVIWKLERIAERHRVVLTYLADFIGRGNYLDMLYGNHDAEFFWPGVKAAFVQTLATIYFGPEIIEGYTEDHFRSQIRWHEWFLYEPGKYYIAHGNQYDDFSSFEHRLCPVLPFKPTSLDMPASHMAIRYFVNRIKGFQTHNKDNWTLLDFLKWMYQQGWKQVRFILGTYAALVRKTLRYARRIQNTDSLTVESTHRARLEELASAYALDPEKVTELDALRSRPVHHTTGSTVQATGIDQWAYAGAMLGLPILALLVSSTRWTILLVLLWLALLVGRKQVMSFVRNRILGGEFETVIPPKLEVAAGEIAEILDVRYVIFGHTHRPIIKNLRAEPPAFYVNLGAWLVPKEPERFKGLSPLTYAVILDQAQPEATLFRWDLKELRPGPLVPKLQPDATGNSSSGHIAAVPERAAPAPTDDETRAEESKPLPKTRQLPPAQERSPRVEPVATLPERPSRLTKRRDRRSLRKSRY